MTDGHTKSGKGPARYLVFILPATAILLVAALWRFTPLHEIVSLEKLQNIMREQWTKQWWTILLVIAVYIIANLLIFPNSILNIAVIIGVGGFVGWLYAICGSLSAATLFFFMGRFWGAERLNALSHAGIPKIRKFLAKGGIAAVVAVHAIPTGPYAVVNSIIGTFNIGYRDFIIGTFIGHLPGTLFLALFGKQMKSILEDPSPQNIAVAMLIILAAVGLIVVLRIKLKANIVEDYGLDNSEALP